MTLNHAILSAPQEQELLIRIHKGDLDAQTTLLESNERLIMKTALKFIKNAAPDVELDDLMQQGRLGLLHAAGKWSFKVAKKRGVKKFSTYASWWVYQYIRRYACHHRSGFSRSVELDDLSYAVYRTKADLHDELKREPTYKELSEDTKIPERKIRAILDTPGVIRLDEPVQRNNNSAEETNHYLIQDPHANVKDTTEASMIVAEYMTLLEENHPKHAEVVRMIYGVNENQHIYSVAEVAKMMNVSRQYIYQILEEAMEFLRG